jgi:hypothetical protein
MEQRGKKAEKAGRDPCVEEWIGGGLTGPSPLRGSEGDYCSILTLTGLDAL